MSEIIRTSRNSLIQVQYQPLHAASPAWTSNLSSSISPDRSVNRDPILSPAFDSNFDLGCDGNARITYGVWLLMGKRQKMLAQKNLWFRKAKKKSKDRRVLSLTRTWYFLIPSRHAHHSATIANARSVYPSAEAQPPTIIYYRSWDLTWPITQAQSGSRAADVLRSKRVKFIRYQTSLPYREVETEDKGFSV
ncbi:hypothetical protein EVAR_62228_1 [Eumeta japonica]|uniref:Uncharacterized protein n=1 Tax=Eumeta variegata TaxID=151549 RepID=A0A4C1ZI05_EUMVA|nr:hypothetical protein EVAR_62228_1 [Eumeta japonica]